MRRLTLPLAIASGLSALLVATAAFAGADPGLLPTQGDIVKESEKKDSAWDPSLSLGASLALSSNSDVVGQPDGSSYTVGLNLHGSLNYLKEMHDWRNTLKIQEVFSRTPIIDSWVKTIDQLLIESIYYMRITPRFGPFASFKMETAIFEGFDVRGADTTYVLAGDTLATSVRRIKLTDAFQPLVLKESIGVFYRPIAEDFLGINLRAGFGAHETFAAGALVVDDSADTAELELRELEDFVQAGAVIGLEAKGELEDGRVSYSAHGEVMFPLINDDAEDRSVMDLTNYDFGVKIAFKLFEWASLDYEFKAYLQPQVSEDWQVQNNLLLTLSYTLIE
ncbi:MAG: hypothetical protein CSA66_00760 [Proteobacteria bacterium]|nr:MAG: hypothetical protein CSA66_00760 [Pseudomonadota bacterium]